MKYCVSTFYCLLLPFLSTVSADRTLCDYHRITCNPGYVCCYNDGYNCCLGNQVIAAIVIGSVVLVLILILILCKVTQCNKLPRVIQCNKLPRAINPVQTSNVVPLTAAGDYTHFETTGDGIPDMGNMIVSKPPAIHTLPRV